jgi:hypothetical protein
MVESESLCEIVWDVGRIVVPQILCLIKVIKIWLKNKLSCKTNNLNTIFNLLQIQGESMRVERKKSM